MAFNRQKLPSYSWHYVLVIVAVAFGTIAQAHMPEHRAKRPYDHRVLQEHPSHYQNVPAYQPAPRYQYGTAQRPTTLHRQLPPRIVQPQHYEAPAFREPSQNCTTYPVESCKLPAPQPPRQAVKPQQDCIYKHYTEVECREIRRVRLVCERGELIDGVCVVRLRRSKLVCPPGLVLMDNVCVTLRKPVRERFHYTNGGGGSYDRTPSKPTPPAPPSKGGHGNGSAGNGSAGNGSAGKGSTGNGNAGASW